MSGLFNPYALTALGKPLQQRQSPELRVETPYVTRAQLDMAQHTFVRFLDQARLSRVPNPTQQGRLADGTPYRIVTASGAPIMQVWPAEPVPGGTIPRFWSGFVFASPDGDQYYVLDAVMTPTPEDEAEEREGQRGVHTGEWEVVKLSPKKYERLHRVNAVRGDLAPSVYGVDYHLGGDVYGINVVKGFDEVQGISHRNVLGYITTSDFIEGEKHYLVLIKTEDGALQQANVELKKMPGPKKGKSRQLLYEIIDPEEINFKTIATGVRRDAFWRPYRKDKLIYEHVTGSNYKYTVMALDGLRLTEGDTVESQHDEIEPAVIPSVEDEGTALNNFYFVVLEIGKGSSLELQKSQSVSVSDVRVRQGDHGFWRVFFGNVEYRNSSSRDADFSARTLDYAIVSPPSFDREGTPVFLESERKAEYSLTISDSSVQTTSSHAFGGRAYESESEAWGGVAEGSKSPGLEWPDSNGSSNSSTVHKNTIERKCKLADGSDFILMDSKSEFTISAKSNFRIRANTGMGGDYRNSSINVRINISVIDREILAYDPELEFLVCYEGMAKVEYSGTDSSNSVFGETGENDKDTIITRTFADLPKVESIKLQYSRVSISLGRDVKVEIPVITRLADIYPCFHSPCGWVSGGEVLPDTIGAVKYHYISQIPRKIPIARGESEIYDLFKPPAVAPKQYRVNKPEITCRVYKTPRAGALFVHILIDGEEFKYFVDSKEVVEIQELFDRYKLPLDKTIGDEKVEII